jgi:hypothetical protein
MVVSPSVLHALLHLALIEIAISIFNAEFFITEVLLLDLLILVFHFFGVICVFFMLSRHRLHNFCILLLFWLGYRFLPYLLLCPLLLFFGACLVFVRFA